MPVILKIKCPKCGGKLIQDQEEVFCINCGYRPPVDISEYQATHTKGGNCKW
jgi:uncharacterized Zn finger protein (UPF0148 family)